MAAVRRAVSVAAAAGRYGLGTLGRQDALNPSMATVHRSLSSPTAGGKLGLGARGLKDALNPSMATVHRSLSSPTAGGKPGFGARGLQVRSIWNGPKWMTEHLEQVAVDPELAFQNLRADDKDLLVLMHLTASDQTRRVLQSNNAGVEVVLLEFAKLYDKQVDMEQGLWALVVVLVGGVGSLAYFVKGVKNHCSELLECLASNSGSIVAALVSAGKHGVGSWFLGKGEPFAFDFEWLKKKNEDKTKTEEENGGKIKSEEKKVEETKPFKYQSRFFRKNPEEK